MVCLEKLESIWRRSVDSTDTGVNLPHFPNIRVAEAGAEGWLWEDEKWIYNFRLCGQQPARDGLPYFWVDTCCINKSRNSKLSEAINPMFRYCVVLQSGNILCISGRYLDKLSNRSVFDAMGSSFCEYSMVDP